MHDSVVVQRLLLGLNQYLGIISYVGLWSTLHDPGNDWHVAIRVLVELPLEDFHSFF